MTCRFTWREPEQPVERCAGAVFALGLCRAHYAQRRRGVPLHPVERRVPGRPLDVRLASVRVPRDVAEWFAWRAERERRSIYSLMREALTATAREEAP